MLTITNKYHLPGAILHAVSHDRYDPGDGDVSCTTLIAPAQIYQLNQLHKGDEVFEDASDRIWSMIGSAVHYILENAITDMKAKGITDIISERRFYHTVGGKKVSAQIDLYEDKELSDFKVTSVWAIKDALKKGKDEWTAQLNIQRYLMHHNGIEVNKMWIVAIARDWNKSGRLRDKEYPPRAVRVPIKVWSIEQTESYIIGRINALFSPHRILCTPVECWESPAKHAVMKNTAQKALRLLDTHADAMNWATTKGHCDVISEVEGESVLYGLKSGYRIDFRPGERKRCQDYCEVMPFCEQYADWVKQNNAKVAANAG